MERPRHRHHSDSHQRHQNEYALTNFASIAMQSSSHQLNPSHQSNNAQERPQAHARAQAQAQPQSSQSHVQPQNQLDHGGPSSTTNSGRSILSQPPGTHESSDLSHSLPPNQHGRIENMDLMTAWGRNAGLPFMEDAYAATTQLTAMGTHLQLPMSILSVETYHPGTADRSQSSSRPRQQSTSQPLGNSNAAGVAQDQAMQSWGLMRVNESETNSNANPQKRKSSDDDGNGNGKGKKKKQKVETLSDDDEAKKSRGRPRLDPKDETAADRRRTQIRMAQRAYRHRKETTISTLEAQVQDLKGTNEEMSNIFTNLYDMAVKNGLLHREPDFGIQLKSATEKFYTLAQSAAIDSEQKDDEPASSSQNQSLIDEPSFSNQHTTNPQQLEQLKSDALQPSTNTMWGYQISEEPPVKQDNIDYGFMPFVAPPQGQHANNLMVVAHATEDNASWSWDLPYTQDQQDQGHQTNSHTVITRATEDNASLSWDLPYIQEQQDQGHQTNSHTVITRATEDNASLSWDLPYTQDQQDQGHQTNSHTVITRATEENASFPYEFWSDVQTFNANIPPVENYSHFLPSQSLPSQALPYQSLPLPQSFAYSEVSFSRRLHRTTIETAYTLVTMASPPPDLYEKVFGFCLRFESKAAIERRLRGCLESSTKEPINTWNAPFVHLGGAGTKYPVDPVDLYSESMPKFRTGLSMGPFSTDVTDTHNNYIINNLQITLPGFQGSYFDANDVEGYLRGKGIEIKPNSEFVEVDLDALQEYDDLSSDSTSDRSPHISNALPHSQSAENHEVISSDFFDNASSRLADSYSIGYPIISQPFPTSYPGMKDAHPAFIDPVASNPAFQFRDDFNWPFDQKDVQDFNNNNNTSFGFVGKRKKIVRLRIDTLMQAIMRGAQCLGRSPGFRVLDVDYAIRVSLRDAKAEEHQIRDA